MATFTDRKRIVSDEATELHNFAKLIKLTPPTGKYLNGIWYDLPARLLQPAIDHGAKMVSDAELNRKIEDLRRYRLLHLHHTHIVHEYFGLYGCEHPA